MPQLTPNNNSLAEEKEEDRPRVGLDQGAEPMDRQQSVKQEQADTATQQVKTDTTAHSSQSTSLKKYDLLLNRLRTNTLKNPTKRALAFLDAKGAIDHSLTYAELDQATHQLAEHLQSRGICAGDRVLLVYPPCLHFTVAFLACCRAGLVAVPVFPPHPHRRDSLHMFAGIVATCGAQVALTDTSYNYQKKLSSIQDALVTKLHQRPVAAWPEKLTWIVTDTIAKQRKPPPLPSDSSSSSTPFSTTTVSADSLGSQVAFLQFTSGSTSDPKGVMITHGNLAHNLHCIVTELNASDDTIVVSWLPQYHDMGLIGSVLGCLYCGGTGYYISPLVFLQRPALWIETVARYRATHLQTPNFALKLVARKWNTAPTSSTHSSTGKRQGTTADDARLDLSSVRHVINAAEPVDVQSMQVFYDTFVPLGLKRGVVYPTYGLAEHTVFVCSGGQQILRIQKHELEIKGKVIALDAGSAEQRNSVDENEDSESLVSTLVGCGFPKSQGIDVVIVNTETRTMVGEDVVGEIWVDSPSKAAGYYGKPKDSFDDFHATLSTSPNDKEGYLRTGDLGFLHNDELFICGRLKDLIIIGGRNYYPQDIEATAEASSDKVRLGCSAAFTIDPAHQGGEEVALVTELKEVPPTKDVESVCLALANHLRAAINQEHSLGISSIAFLKTRTVPKTSSGKIARAWCRKGYLAGTLQEVYRRDFKVDSSSPRTDQSTGPVRLETKASPPTSIDAPTIRAMTKTDILNKLVADLSRVGGVSIDSIDVKAPLVHMLDSLTISQFKGMLENNYAVKLSDEYLFRESTTTTKLVEVVKLGHAPDDADGAKADAMAVQTGKARGLAGALGCPPGVVCIIM